MPASDRLAQLDDLARLIREGGCAPIAASRKGDLRTGVDLGTANIVVVVVDADGTPVAGESVRSTVVRDGIVVDWVGAVNEVRRMKASLEARLGCELVRAATAVPPGILAGNIKAIANAVEAAGFQVADVADEPSAAARVLGLVDGAVVDVGGGTTGISVLRNGEVVFTDDEATGGTHMTLVLAGAYGIPTDEAEAMKLDAARVREVFPVVRPVIEKMAAIVERCLAGHDVDTIHVVGGACSFDEFEAIFAKWTGRTVVKPPHPLLVTPFGIALWDATGGAP